MKNRFKHNVLLSCIVLTASVATWSACSDILDETPDNRTEIDSVKKIKQLLTSAYPDKSAALLCDLSGDSYVDNNVEVASAHNSSDYAWQDQAYAWEDVTNYTEGEDDTPFSVWDSYYKAIATCNHALEAIDEMEKKANADVDKLEHYRGEALVQRAFLHFVLVNVFSLPYKDSISSLNDPGIPYVTKPETVVRVNYDRSSVTETYQAIEQDLLAGLPLISDVAYDVRAYHMNEAAANAFAARFYLFKREWAKVLNYADVVLGGNPIDVLRKWRTMTGSTPEAKNLWFNDEAASTNLMIQCAYSTHCRMFSAARYGCNGLTQQVMGNGSGPCWSGRLPCFDGWLYTYEQKYGLFACRIVEQFEYTDKIAGIGYVHTLYHPLSTEETLLCRAEARLYLGDRDGCISDMNIWAKSKLCTQNLSLSSINRFYYAGRTGFVCDINIDKMGWSAADVATATTNKSVVDCLLHFRHIENFYEGMRWFDIKRYGIPVTHEYKGSRDDFSTTDVLDWNDPRRALQVPTQSINAGLVANDRTKTTVKGENTAMIIPVK